ncbi:hypothetical protein E2C01_078316 [Portunus trituberculatus]|uniref:Uncharacterized protein n=1 Tax=Portunus trituberculatus TaxID=210409 RepID=A0A5B7ITU3_PORTR|nr:hypothetical protein [Portunus trituberculatus]
MVLKAAEERVEGGKKEGGGGRKERGAGRVGEAEGAVRRSAHPLGNRCLKRGSPTYTRIVDRIRTSALGDPSDPKARMVPLYAPFLKSHI